MWLQNAWETNGWRTAEWRETKWGKCSKLEKNEVGVGLGGERGGELGIVRLMWRMYEVGLCHFYLMPAALPQHRWKDCRWRGLWDAAWQKHLSVAVRLQKRWHADKMMKSTLSDDLIQIIRLMQYVTKCVVVFYPFCKLLNYTPSYKKCITTQLEQTDLTSVLSILCSISSKSYYSNLNW